MITITTWKWGKKFADFHVQKLAASVKRHLRQSYKFICFTDVPTQISGVKSVWIKDIGLTKERGCFARLRLFDPTWQKEWIGAGDRIVCIDLDTVVTGGLDVLFDRTEPFVIMQGGNASNPCPYNGALMMVRRGAHPEVWYDFSVEAASKVPYYEFPDDQGWLWHKIPNAAGWQCGKASGVYVFHKPGWPGWRNKSHASTDEFLPTNARLITFSGWRSPERFFHLPWVREHWRP